MMSIKHQMLRPINLKYHFYFPVKRFFEAIKGLLILKKQDNEANYCNVSELARDEHVKSDHPYACCINFPKNANTKKYINSSYYHQHLVLSLHDCKR